MYVCNSFPYTLDFFLLDEKEAEDVVFFICRMMEKGKETETGAEKTVKKEKKKKVYADQASWY